jgi:hypothetical protein
MQCPTCDRRVARNKSGLIEKHYIEEFYFIGWEQKECPAVGTENGKGWSIYEANKSRMRCPCCDKSVNKKKDGRMRVHNNGNRECKASVANRG